MSNRLSLDMALLGHHNWANAAIRNAASRLSQDELYTVFNVGKGNLATTILHIAGAIMRWCDRIEKREFRPFPEDEERRFSWDEISCIAENADAELSEVMDRDHSSATLIVSNGTEVTISADVAIGHVLSHGSHHRAQLLNMLRQLDYDDIPEIDVIDWILSREQI